GRQGPSLQSEIVDGVGFGVGSGAVSVTTTLSSAGPQPLSVVLVNVKVALELVATNEYVLCSHFMSLRVFTAAPVSKLNDWMSAPVAPTVSVLRLGPQSGFPERSNVTV